MLQVFMSDERLRAALAEAKTIAIVGAKDKQGQAVDDVGRYLIAAGYRVIPVHPVRKNVWGLNTYASLAENSGTGGYCGCFPCTRILSGPCS